MTVLLEPASPPVPPPENGPRLRREWLRRVVAAIPASAMAVIVGALYLYNLTGFPRFINDDEGTYVAQAWATAHENYMAHYTYWYDHPPLGWIQLSFFLHQMEWLTGSETLIGAGRAVMGLVMIISALLLYTLARNVGAPRLVASAAPIVWAVSPLTLVFGRQIYLDNIALMWTLAAFVLVTRRSVRLEHVVLSGICFGIAVLSKETALLAAPALVYAIRQHTWWRIRAFAYTGWMVSFALVTMGYVVFAGLKGEIFPGEGHNSLLGGALWQLSGRGESGFILEPGSISNETLMTWVRADPTLLAAGSLTTLIALAVPRFRPLAAVPLVYFAVSLRGGYVPNMYAIAPNAFFALLIVLVVWKGWEAVRRSPRPALYAARTGVVLAAVAALFLAAPSSATAVATAMTEYQNHPTEDGLRWIIENVPQDSTMLVDDNTWTDLVDAGWSADRWHGPVWHYKLDRDPEAVKNLPNGWRDMDYVLMAPGLTSQLGTTNLTWKVSPQVVSAMENSTVIRSWGEFPFQVELRTVDPAQPTGCVRWSCPEQEPAWLIEEGIGGSPAAEERGRGLAVRVAAGDVSLPEPPAMLPVPPAQRYPVPVVGRDE